MAEPQSSGGRIPAFEIRHRMERALEAAGLSRDDIATELGVHRNTVSNYLSGRTPPSRAVLIAWHLRTGVPLRWLETGESGDPGRNPVNSPVTDQYHAASALLAA